MSELVVNSEARTSRSSSASGKKKLSKQKSKTSRINSKFPEWNEAIENTEKWPTKPIFEDPDFVSYLPIELREKCATWKRFSEFFHPKRIQMNPSIEGKPKESSPSPLSPTKPVKEAEPEDSMKEGNCQSWLSHDEQNSKFMAIAFHLLLQNQNRMDEENFLWNLISPKGKDGKPIVHPGGNFTSYSFKAKANIL